MSGADLITRASVMDAACTAVADAWEAKNVSVAGALIDAINGVPAVHSGEGRDSAADLIVTFEYLLPHLAELDRAERHRNRDNPTAVLHAQACINNVRNALAKARGDA